MSDLFTSREDLEELRDAISKMRSFIEYDIYNHPKGELFEELDILLKDAVLHLDKMDKELVQCLRIRCDCYCYKTCVCEGIR